MSKIYQCNNCARQETSIDFFLEIGTTNNSLFIKNKAQGSNKREINNFDDLHFCSQKCLNDFLFKPLVQREQLVLALIKDKEYFINQHSVTGDTVKKFDDIINFLNGYCPVK